MAAKTPRRGQRGSRRWKQLRAAQRRAEARHRRRVRHAHHQAAHTVVAWALGQRMGTLVVGHPRAAPSNEFRLEATQVTQFRAPIGRTAPLYVAVMLGSITIPLEPVGRIVARVHAEAAAAGDFVPAAAKGPT
jgi:hypothetical protein